MVSNQRLEEIAKYKDVDGEMARELLELRQREEWVKVMDGALALQAKVNATILPLVPKYGHTFGPEREKWQTLIDAIHRCADYADAHRAELEAMSKFAAPPKEGL